jgi:hypothetical protein
MLYSSFSSKFLSVIYSFKISPFFTESPCSQILSRLARTGRSVLQPTLLVGSSGYSSSVLFMNLFTPLLDVGDCVRSFHPFFSIHQFSHLFLGRPLMLPIYLSSSAFNYAAMTSYNNFSFLQHLRFSAFFPEPATTPQSPSDPEYDAFPDGSQSWKSGIAETFFFYSQNLPTVVMLLPRAGLSMALLFAFSSPSAFDIPSVSLRDQTFFRSDGSLTDYARGVLYANAAWTGWRLLVLIASWSVVVDHSIAF